MMDVNRELEGEEKSFSEKKAEGDSSTQRRNQGWKELPLDVCLRPTSYVTITPSSTHVFVSVPKMY
jgi:hypothetical protein